MMLSMVRVASLFKVMRSPFTPLVMVYGPPSLDVMVIDLPLMVIVVASVIF